MTGIDIVRSCTHLHGTLIILCLIPSGLITTVPGVLRSSLFPFPHDLIISLLYLFEHYFSEDADLIRDRDSLQNGLIQAGFSPAEINKAFDWLDTLAARDRNDLALSARRKSRATTDEGTPAPAETPPDGVPPLLVWEV